MATIADCALLYHTNRVPACEAGPGSRRPEVVGAHLRRRAKRPEDGLAAWCAACVPVTAMSLRVLVGLDDPFARTAVHDGLVPFGFAVRDASSAASARALLMQWRPHVAILSQDAEPALVRMLLDRETGVLLIPAGAVPDLSCILRPMLESARRPTLPETWRRA